MSNDEKVLFETLYAKYKKMAISKKEMSMETGVSISTLDRQRKSGLGCSYIKKNNSDVFYPLQEIAKYYTSVVQTY